MHSTRASHAKKPHVFYLVSYLASIVQGHMRLLFDEFRALFSSSTVQNCKLEGLMINVYTIQG